MFKRLCRWRTKLLRLCTHTGLSFLTYRYRYLVCFTVIGCLSILLEILLASQLMPSDWPWLTRACLAFVVGLLFSFSANAWINFQVPRPYLFRTFRRFAMISLLSFGLNLLAIQGCQEVFAYPYALARAVSAGMLFCIAYTLHRRYTFDCSRNFGIAVYASRAEKVYEIFYRIGRNCDHIHIDLIDESMGKDVSPVDLGKITLARKLWRGIPVCLHAMSMHPARWFEKACDQIDWFLFHVNSRDDPLQLILRCRFAGKKVGVVWHTSAAPGALLPLLPHVDFVMVLGIPEPGRSGQRVTEEAIALAGVLDELRPRYGYEVMFDGGVTLANIQRIRARYVVAASAVLRAKNPILSAHSLRTSSKYERLSA
ncbi:MAG: GtrA family protein [Gemmataceae bacterium]|nr:GtrA family protein [Gemmataceae bacterium]